MSITLLLYAYLLTNWCQIKGNIQVHMTRKDSANHFCALSLVELASHSLKNHSK